MNWINKLKLVYRAFARRVFITLLLVSMSVMSFYMIDNVLMNYLRDKYLIDRTEYMFGVNPDRVCFVRMLNEDTPRGVSEQLKQYINQHERVEAAGHYTHHTTNDLLATQGITMVVSEVALIDMGNLKLTDEQKAMLREYDGKYEPALLGSDYRGKVQVGDVFTLSLFKEKDCIIVGFLEKGAAWPKSQGLFRGTDNSNLYNLDSQGILLTDQYDNYDSSDGRGDIYYITSVDNDEQVRKDIIQYAMEKNISVRVTNQGEDIETEINANSVISDKTFTAAILLTILAVVSMTASSVIYCMINKKQYGTMMVCGVRRKDIMWMLVAQNALIIMLSAIVAWVVRQREIFGSVIPNKSIKMMVVPEMLYLQLFVPHNIYIPIILVILVLIMLIVASVLPIVIIKKMPLLDMIQGKE